MLTEQRGDESSAPAARGRRRGARIERRRSSHSYVTVLVLITAQFLFLSAAPDRPWARAVLLLLGCTTLVASLWASGLALSKGGLRAAGRPPLALLAVASSVLALVQILNGGDAVTAVVLLAGVLLIAATVSALGVGVFDQDDVNVQSVLGAICIYLLAGLIFTWIYGAVATLGDAPFFNQAVGDGTAADRPYFSYVTLATLGYGDLTPATELGHTLAVTEALLGQLYLVTVVAVLVSRVGRNRAD
jgi:hypothetical protein